MAKEVPSRFRGGEAEYDTFHGAAGKHSSLGNRDHSKRHPVGRTTFMPRTTADHRTKICYLSP
jgi:hypothetical protein